MKASLFVSKFRTLSQTKFVDFTASTDRMAYLTAEIAILSAVLCLISSGMLGDRRSTSDLARETLSSRTWSKVIYRGGRADVRCASSRRWPMGRYMNLLAAFRVPEPQD